MEPVLASLDPKEAEVQVGRDRLILRTAVLLQEEEFLAALSDLDLERVFSPLGKIIAAVRGDDDGGVKLGRIADLVMNLGPEVMAAAKPLLGRQLAPILGKCCLALLDVVENHEALQKAGVLKADQKPEFDRDGVYLRSPGLRAWIRTNLTARQAVEIVKTAWKVNDYGDLLGKLVSLQAEAAPRAEATATLQ